MQNAANGSLVCEDRDWALVDLDGYRFERFEIAPTHNTQTEDDQREECRLRVQPTPWTSQSPGINRVIILRGKRAVQVFLSNPRNWPCTFFRNVRPGLIRTASSSQVPRRHPKVTTYRCCLPALAGFVGFCRVGPNLQHHLSRTVPKRAPLEKEFDLAVAGCESLAEARSGHR